MGQPAGARAGRAGTSSAPRSRWSTSAAPSTSRAAAATWSSRTTRCAPARRRSPTRARPFAQVYAHAGMVGYDGEKMSKSRGNLVFVSALRNSDVDPMAIRLALLRHHYRSDWEWTDARALGRRRRARRLAQGALAGRRRPGRAGRRRRCSTRWPTTSTPRPRWPRSTRWVAATLGTDGLADTSDPDAAMTMFAPCSTRPSASRSGSTGTRAVGRSTRRRRRRALEVALELAGDRVAGRLGQVGGVARLLERPDVVGDVLVLLGELVDAALPGAGVLGQVAEGDAHLEQVLELAEQRQGGLRARRLGDVVGDRRPVGHGRDVEPDAGVLEDADDAGGPFVRRLLELEPVDQLGLGGRAGDRDRPGVRGVGEQRAQGDHELAARGRRTRPAARRRTGASACWARCRGPGSRRGPGRAGRRPRAGCWAR